MKFGKYLEERELKLPEFSGYFIDYRGLKKLIKQLASVNSTTTNAVANGINQNIDPTGNKTASLTNDSEDPFLDPLSYKRLQENKATFFFRLERELEKVNSYYLQKESDLRINFNILSSRLESLRLSGKIITKNDRSFRPMYTAFLKFQKDLIDFEQYIELNKTGFSKVLKKWDKRSRSQDKEFYLATVVSVQSVFTSTSISSLNDEVLQILSDFYDLQNINNIDKNNNIHNNNTNNDNVENISNARGSIAYGKLGEIFNNESNEGKFASFDSNDVPAHRVIKAANSITSNFSNFMDEDSLIDSWFAELMAIAKLKDDGRRYTMLNSFYHDKICNLYNKDANAYNLSLKDNTVLDRLLSKLFLLLTVSKISDNSLQIFYNTVKDKVDLSYLDETEHMFLKRNILHEAAHCYAEARTFIFEQAITHLPPEVLKNILNAKDIHLRTPLFYATELGKFEIVKLLLHSDLLTNSIHDVDDNYKSPLILSIENNFLDIMKEIIEYDISTSSFSSSNERPYFPLIIACQTNNYQAAKMLLDFYKRQLNDLNLIKDSNGLNLLHIAAKNGDAKLIILLVGFGVDPNSLDELNKATPIFYAIKESNDVTVKALLQNGARLDVLDNDQKDPLYYTLWESNIETLNTLLPYIKSLQSENSRDRSIKSSTSPSVISSVSTNKIADIIMDHDYLNSTDSLEEVVEDIPDFALPPPIIPLRKYGHNFLEKKVSVQIIFDKKTEFIKFDNKADQFIVSKPGRITVTNSVNVLPKNIVLESLASNIEDEIENDLGITTIQVDTLDDLVVDFEVYPEYGTKLIAKTTVMPFVFKNKVNINEDKVQLPLFDVKLNQIGTIRFTCQIIFPFSGKPLQISKYEPYWKSTTENSNSSNNLLSNEILQTDNKGNFTVSHYITSSSMTSTFINLKVFSLYDGTLVVSPHFYIEFNGTRFLIIELTKGQLEKLCGYKLDYLEYKDVQNEDALISQIDSRIMDLSVSLNLIPKDIQLNLQVCYPTLKEVNIVPINISSKISINQFIDNILFVVFEHERTLKHNDNVTRSISFSSCNWQVCSILNWKQPNFPVLLQMNTIIFKNEDNIFVKDTAHHLKSSAVKFKNYDKTKPLDDMSQPNDAYDFRSYKPNFINDDYNDVIVTDCIFIKNMIKFAVSNNVFGVIIPQEILELSDLLVSTIKGNELLLIGSQSNNRPTSHGSNIKLNGILKDFKLIIEDQ